ncbi:hypothetical protein KI387_020038, partial [Taxus chinensis]
RMAMGIVKAGRVGWCSGDAHAHETAGLFLKRKTSLGEARARGRRSKHRSITIVSMSLATQGAAAVNTSEVPSIDPRTVVSVILGGGAGTRLFPLTKRRAKPAVPIGGAYRLIDVPMSNCINSGINKIYILTQFNSASLNRHLSRAYNFGNGVNFGDGFVE